MSQYGLYDPTNANNRSDLFVYREVPVASAKLNDWSGNIHANFNLFHQVCATLASGQTSVVLQWSDHPSLKVTAGDPPGGSVFIQPGWAVVETSLAGAVETTAIPAVDIPPPTVFPRIDLVVLRRSGAFSVILGTEYVIPKPPAQPDHSIVLAQIAHRVDSELILDEDDGIHSYLIDKRKLLTVGESHRHSSDCFPAESPDGIRVQFNTQHRFKDGSLQVFLNGVLQESGADYAESPERDGYLFTVAPLPHYRIQHRYIIDF